MSREPDFGAPREFPCVSLCLILPIFAFYDVGRFPSAHPGAASAYRCAAAAARKAFPPLLPACESGPLKTARVGWGPFFFFFLFFFLRFSGLRRRPRHAEGGGGGGPPEQRRHKGQPCRRRLSGAPTACLLLFAAAAFSLARPRLRACAACALIPQLSPGRRDVKRGQWGGGANQAVSLTLPPQPACLLAADISMSSRTYEHKGSLSFGPTLPPHTVFVAFDAE
ncbi:hypothetical protein HPB50_026128 [Hyalomma asiaticum]|uniref:Uncharacterized protein n=1 Tax=Hyalomma asiaticum TaxID=266040 RepID=A0ACB7SCH4_HYAAI|nr:hypothetical protein HPB50_026128 [Hyalomma asiaticum]